MKLGSNKWFLEISFDSIFNVMKREEKKEKYL